MTENKAEIKATTFWRKAFPVQAIRVTEDNIQQVADAVDGSVEKTVEDLRFVRFAGLTGNRAFVGEWIIVEERGSYMFTHENFLRKFWTPSEQLATDEKFAKVHALIRKAMNAQDAATYHGDSGGDDTDLVAIEVTNEIINGI